MPGALSVDRTGCLSPGGFAPRTLRVRRECCVLCRHAPSTLRVRRVAVLMVLSRQRGQRDLNSCENPRRPRCQEST